MNELEGGQLSKLKECVHTRIRARHDASWEDRRATANDLLREIYSTWWMVHNANPSSYQDDLDGINGRLRLSGERAQIQDWISTACERLLMPPKFFGGDPLGLDEQFVASMSLNHAVPANKKLFESELRDQQDEESTFDAHRNYFSKDYVYGAFFKSRARVLRAYASAIRHSIDEDWLDLDVNRRYALYIERFPTRSKKFQKSRHAQATELAQYSFVMALNSLTHEIVFNLLRPRLVLLAGCDTWEAWPKPYGVDERERVKPGGSCPVYIGEHHCEQTGRRMTLIRTWFLRIHKGLNSNEELDRLGTLMGQCSACE